MANSAIKTLTWTTTNDLVAKKVSKQGYKSLTIIFRNTGANGANVKVDGGVDNTNFPVAIQASQVVAAGGTLALHYNTNYLPFISVSAESAVDGAHTTVEAKLAFYEF